METINCCVFDNNRGYVDNALLAVKGIQMAIMSNCSNNDRSL